jgi:hypothetical protein
VLQRETKRSGDERQLVDITPMELAEDPLGNRVAGETQRDCDREDEGRHGAARARSSLGGGGTSAQPSQCGHGAEPCKQHSDGTTRE